MKLLIGSRALAHWDNTIKLKESTDWDIISFEQIEGAEFHDANFLNNSVFLKYASDDVIKFNEHELRVVNPIGLAIIKRSHLWRDLSFDKHITHYQNHLSKYRSQFSEDDERVLTERTTLTHKEFPQGYPKLNKTVSDFFDDAVTKKFDHDELHQILAFNDVPMYTKMQRDSGLAWCEKDMWDNFSELEKQQCVAEETYVISVERFMVPSNWKTPIISCSLTVTDRHLPMIFRGSWSARKTGLFL